MAAARLDDVGRVSTQQALSFIRKARHFAAALKKPVAAQQELPPPQAQEAATAEAMALSAQEATVTEAGVFLQPTAELAELADMDVVPCLGAVVVPCPRPQPLPLPLPIEQECPCFPPTRPAPPRPQQKIVVNIPLPAPPPLPITVQEISVPEPEPAPIPMPVARPFGSVAPFNVVVTAQSEPEIISRADMRTLYNEILRGHCKDLVDACDLARCSELKPSWAAMASMTQATAQAMYDYNTHVLPHIDDGAPGCADKSVNLGNGGTDARWAAFAEQQIRADLEKRLRYCTYAKAVLETKQAIAHCGCEIPEESVCLGAYHTPCAVRVDLVVNYDACPELDAMSLTQRCMCRLCHHCEGCHHLVAGQSLADRFMQGARPACCLPCPACKRLYCAYSVRAFRVAPKKKPEHGAGMAKAREQVNRKTATGSKSSPPSSLGDGPEQPRSKKPKLGVGSDSY